MKTIDLAIITPTLNEEHFIGILLDSIARQGLQPKEVVVVDAFSDDKTKIEVKKRQKKLPQLQFYQIPKSSISRQRNFGAQKTSASHLLFLDADMELKDRDTLAKYLAEVEKKDPDVALAVNKPLSCYWKDQLYFWGMDLIFRLSRPIWPIVTAMNLYVKRATFEKVGGFAEGVKVGEDVELVQRIKKRGGKYVILSKVKVYTSVRRQEKEGRRKFVLKLMKILLQVGRGKKMGEIDIEYEFGRFSKSK